ncbi:MAG: hypothetical protein U0441_34490 [Polyangiaceae bacterium]
MRDLNRSGRRSLMIAFVFGSLALPLVWGACNEGPPAATPAVSLDERAGGSTSGEPAGDDSSPPAPRPKPEPPETGLDRGTMKAIRAELAKLPPTKTGTLSFAECSAIFSPPQNAVTLALKAASACKSDSDCVLASDGTCVTGGCGASVAKDQKAAFDKAIKEIADTACPAWKAGDCDSTYPRAIPSCAVPSAHCEQGRCSP